MREVNRRGPRTGRPEIAPLVIVGDGAMSPSCADTATIRRRRTRRTESFVKSLSASIDDKRRKTEGMRRVKGGVLGNCRGEDGLELGRVWNVELGCGF